MAYYIIWVRGERDEERRKYTVVVDMLRPVALRGVNGENDDDYGTTAVTVTMMMMLQYSTAHGSVLAYIHDIDHDLCLVRCWAVDDVEEFDNDDMSATTRTTHRMYFYQTTTATERLIVEYMTWVLLPLCSATIHGGGSNLPVIIPVIQYMVSHICRMQIRFPARE